MSVDTSRNTPRGAPSNTKLLWLVGDGGDLVLSERYEVDVLPRPATKAFDRVEVSGVANGCAALRGDLGRRA